MGLNVGANAYKMESNAIAIDIIKVVQYFKLENKNLVLNFTYLWCMAKTQPRTSRKNDLRSLLAK